MKVLAIHPSGLIYTRIYTRLEPLGLELICQAMRQAGHQVQLFDLQVEKLKDVYKALKSWNPDVVALSCNYLAHIPEVINIAKAIKTYNPKCFIFVGGHSASFTADELLEHSNGVIDCILKGEGEAAVKILLQVYQEDRRAISTVPGVVTKDGVGPNPIFSHSINDLLPARDLLHFPRRYFIGILDPIASIEFSRGCPWDCSFCSAWTFYNRSYRLKDPELAVDEVRQIKEPGIFIVDDIAFLQESQGFAIADGLARKKINKRWYLETRCDVLLRNKEIFKTWQKLGLEYMFLGMEAIDATDLKKFRKRVTPIKNFEALEFARSLGIIVAVNIIADPSWDHHQFETIRRWAESIPEVVNISVFTPYPGTETWYTESRRLTTRDYRLFDIQHSVLPTQMPLKEYYQELTKTQKITYDKFLGFKGFFQLMPFMWRNLSRGQGNSFKLFFGFNSFYNPKLLLRDHQQPVEYELRLPPPQVEKVDPKMLFIHRNAEESVPRVLEPAIEQFVNNSRQGKE